MSDQFSITMDELIARPIIRSDRPFEYMNKMSDLEIDQFVSERCDDLYEEKNYPTDERTKEIDIHILYELFKLGDKK